MKTTSALGLAALAVVAADTPACTQHSALPAGWCPSHWDDVVCWPATRPGWDAEVSCPATFDGVDIDSTKNASRLCWDNGTWNEWRNYSSCLSANDDGVSHSSWVVIIFYVGYSSSLLALLLAIAIFLLCSGLHCLRNTIHTNLFVTFVLRILTWFVQQQWIYTTDLFGTVWCKVTLTLWQYLLVTNFFWMLIEGVYLTLVIVWAYHVDRIRIWWFMLLGWGGPVAIIVAWLVANIMFNPDSTCWHKHTGNVSVDAVSEGNSSSWAAFSGQMTSPFDIILHVPILLVLLVNLVLISVILYMLVLKLRETSTLERRQYRKVAKAMVVLLLLFGVIYGLVLVPIGPDPVAQLLFECTNAVITSTQGLCVAIFFCFLNGEVRQFLSRRLTSWLEQRSVATRSSRLPSLSKTGRLSVTSCGDNNRVGAVAAEDRRLLRDSQL